MGQRTDINGKTVGAPQVLLSFFFPPVNLCTVLVDRVFFFSYFSFIVLVTRFIIDLFFFLLFYSIL